MVRQIAEAHGKKVKIVKGFNWFISFTGAFSKSVRKAAGSLVYKKDLSAYKDDYNIYDFSETIRRTEGFGSEE